MTQKQKQRTETDKAQDIQEELQSVRKEHVKEIGQQGELVAEEKAQELLIAEREELIQEISARHQIKGYDHTPLDKREVATLLRSSRTCVGGRTWRPTSCRKRAKHAATSIIYS
ncbi:uncharacterized protein B0H18DRAFT_322022 [Fomitopsis serialis]|uniref:uncharacterized protein n=1 Tax=Fomitopsis serialis TaxID=139415 RepID=UPI002007840F|nr:uncharacterized protein B0H18DRAFT_322022 [Neoantrodia serialis]KAH9936393.1 hypothetical protein B0H18DRAFT_322022 [Neoantrodia serialis]